ncbi:MAG: lysylphosphatidylglycerol synthase transmembrane domain-containing protein [Gemmatimonadota bacterium]
MNAALERYRRPLLLTALGGAGLYLVAIVLSDGRAVLERLADLPAWSYPVILGLPTLGFLLRYLRWERLLAALGDRLPRGVHLRIYLAGFALTATPAKVGENLRAMSLRARGVPVSHSLAAFVAERLGDVVAMVLLSGLATHLVAGRGWLLGASTVATLVALWILRSPGFPSWLRRSAPPAGPLNRAFLGVAGVLEVAADLLTPRLLVVGVGLALLAWSAEGVTFGILARLMGAEVSVGAAVGIFAVATLLGAVSFLPGGVGPTEAVMVGLLMVGGATLPQATAATLLTRAVTLWWAVLLGILALGGDEVRNFGTVPPDLSIEDDSPPP